MALQAFLVIASFLVGAVVYREYAYLRFSRPGLRIHVARALQTVDGCHLTATVRNDGSETEHDVQVHLYAASFDDVEIEVEVESSRTKRVLNAEHYLDDSELDPGTFLFWVQTLAPKEALVFTLESASPFDDLAIRVTVGDESDSYQLHDGGGYGGGNILSL